MNSGDADDDRSYRPGWLRFAPFLGRPPMLTRRQWVVLGLVSIVSFFEQYDVYLFSLSLTPLVVFMLFPETAGRRLEEIAPDST